MRTDGCCEVLCAECLGTFNHTEIMYRLQSHLPRPCGEPQAELIEVCRNCYTNTATNFVVEDVVPGLVFVDTDKVIEPDRRCFQCTEIVDDEAAFFWIEAGVLAGSQGTKPHLSRWCESCSRQRVTGNYRRVLHAVTPRCYYETPKPVPVTLGATP